MAGTVRDRDPAVAARDAHEPDPAAVRLNIKGGFVMHYEIKILSFLRKKKPDRLYYTKVDQELALFTDACAMFILKPDEIDYILHGINTEPKEKGILFLKEDEYSDKPPEWCYVESQYWRLPAMKELYEKYKDRSGRKLEYTGLLKKHPQINIHYFDGHTFFVGINEVYKDILWPSSDSVYQKKPDGPVAFYSGSYLRGIVMPVFDDLPKPLQEILRLRLVKNKCLA